MTTYKQIDRSGIFDFGQVTAPGLMQPVLQLAPSSIPNHSLSWSNDGAAATDGSYCFVGSADLVHWHDLSGTLTFTTNGSQVLPAANSAGDSFSVANKPYPYVGVLVLSYTAGDGTTAVKFRYIQGSN